MNENLDVLAFQFFKLFSQYEFSLKKHGYFQGIRNGRSIIVDWDRFVNEQIGANFLDLLGENRASAEYILENPPKRQVVDENNNIVWEPVPNNERNIQALFTHISRMRNNMFHGAKFNGTWFDPQRSNLLLSHGLIVLEHFKYLVDFE
ncbi:hypothetical protein ACS5HP_000921 [Vibrio alginolyticus]